MINLFLKSYRSFNVSFSRTNYYYYYYYYLLLESFSHHFYLMIFHWSLSESKSLQVSRTLLSILAVLSNVVVWMVYTRPLISNSSSPLKIFFGNCTKTTNHDWYNCHLHVPYLFQFPNKFKELILLFTFFQSYSVVSRYSKVHNFTSSLFLLIIRMVKFKFLAHFPVHHLNHPVESCLILFLC